MNETDKSTAESRLGQFHKPALSQCEADGHQIGSHVLSEMITEDSSARVPAVGLQLDLVTSQRKPNMSKEELALSEIEALNTPSLEDDGVLSIASYPTDGFGPDGRVRFFFGN